jgi:hypothetical protein
MKILEITLLFFIAYAVSHYTLTSFGIKERICLVIAVIYAILVSLLLGGVLPA